MVKVYHLYFIFFKIMTDTLCLFQEMFFYNGDCSFGITTYDLIILKIYYLNVFKLRIYIYIYLFPIGL
jgi:hypothetical protein